MKLNEKINKTIKINLNKKYEGKKIINGDEIIEMLKNPFIFRQKNIPKKDLFNSIYKTINSLKKKIGHKDNKKKINEFEKETKDSSYKISRLLAFIEIFIKNNFGYNNIDFENVRNINIDEILDLNIKEKIKIYLELKDLDITVNKKIKFYEENIKTFIELNDSITKNENEVNFYIAQIKTQIEKVEELIKITNIFNEYKSELQLSMLNKDEYKQHSDIFNIKNINSFEIETLYKFLKMNLNGNKFSIIEHNITQFNVFIEILNSFNDLKGRYSKNVDVNFNDEISFYFEF